MQKITIQLTKYQKGGGTAPIPLKEESEMEDLHATRSSCKCLLTF